MDERELEECEIVEKNDISVAATNTGDTDIEELEKNLDQEKTSNNDVPTMEKSDNDMLTEETDTVDNIEPEVLEKTDSDDLEKVTERTSEADQTETIENKETEEPNKDSKAVTEELQKSGESSSIDIIEDEEKSIEFDKDKESQIGIEYLELNNEDSQKNDGDKDKEDEMSENPLFINFDKDVSDKDTSKDDLMDEDPIAADSFITESPEGADEELCIIPDTERVISQAEKDAAFSIPPLRDLSEEVAIEEAQPEITQSDKYIISKCTGDTFKNCNQCILHRKMKYYGTKDTETLYICNDNCLQNFKSANDQDYILNWESDIRVKDLTSSKESNKVAYDRKCVVCQKKVEDDESNLTWEVMDFCNEYCLIKYQREIGAVCANCSTNVRASSLGKYCVRFGNDIRQFCSCHCLEEFKKGLKVCTYCQQDISKGCDSFLAPIGDKGQFKDFCSQNCMEKYDVMTNGKPPNVPEGTKCSVCKTDNTITIEYDADGSLNCFCSDRCFVAFSFVNNITPGKCSMCKRNFPNELLEKTIMFYDNAQYSFCSSVCQNIYIITHRKIVPCAWCKVKKYNFDMIRRYLKTGRTINMCSVNCLNLFQVSVNAVSSKKTICNFCNLRQQSMYHLTMSDSTIRNFCSYACVMSFQNKFKKLPSRRLNSNETFPVPAGEPKKNQPFIASDSSNALENPSARPASPPLPVITNVQSLASNETNSRNQTKTNSNVQQVVTPPVEIPVKVKYYVMLKPPTPPDQRNVATMCKVRQTEKFTNTKKVVMCDKSVQSERREAEKVLIPIPVPIYIPTPLPMYSVPVPYPLPMPLPIPVPIFIPTTRNSAKGIMKEIKKIQVKIPTDPYEAELLMMAEMVAGDKKDENTDSESEPEEPPPADEASFSPEPVDASNTFGEDMLQMALKMATELEEPAVDLEGALTANTITANQGTEGNTEENVDDPQAIIPIPERQSNYRGRKRGRGGRGGGASKRRRMSQPAEVTAVLPASTSSAEPTEKPDAHLCLKYTFGVNAWKQWVTTKNTELEKSSKFSKPFKTEILQLAADELNYSLCLFVKEVRKPNGAEYAPDTIYYLCLGIQQYLFENNRIDNIFCDPYYEQFTDSLDEVARKFSVLYNDSHYIVTRVEEEHLWESKQLGAHSPHVLLSTLMFFNTKHFNLTTVQEHLQLSFSHIMKHWKRNPGQPGAPRVTGSRNVLLRYYPPPAALQNNSHKKKVYEQQENDENPLRCPVKLYEFYLSKCPESVKSRNDVFYLMPERSCVPDSPVWYSTTALPQEALEKMLHRVKMVKEINVALLTS